MGEKDIKRLIDAIQAIGIIDFPDAPLPFPLRCEVLPPAPWDREAIERSLGVTLPPDLDYLWTEASSLRLFEDVTYGQWGLIMWPPEQAIREQKQRISARSKEFRQGDLIVGEFLGDSDLVVMRCDPTEPDFGYVMIALPIDPRSEWYVVADSLGVFLSKFLESRFYKYWEK